VQIESGVSNFSPTPAESRIIIASRYSVPKALMIRFQDDNIDETPDIVRLLRKEQARFVHEQTLPGNHTTPCLGPDDTVLQPQLSVSSLLGTAASLWNYNDLSRVCEVTVDWFDRY
jgi:hypothetical protein